MRLLNLRGIYTNSFSLPLLGWRRVSFRPSISAGVSFKTSLILIPARPSSSKMILLRGLMVLKIISSTTSFSRMFHSIILARLNIFFSNAPSQGFASWGSNVFAVKLKKAERVVNLFLLVFCLFPWVMRARKLKMSSWVISLMSLAPNSLDKRERIYW